MTTTATSLEQQLIDANCTLETALNNGDQNLLNIMFIELQNMKNLFAREGRFRLSGDQTDLTDFSIQRAVDIAARAKEALDKDGSSNPSIRQMRGFIRTIVETTLVDNSQ